mgnify:FL=1
MKLTGISLSIWNTIMDMVAAVKWNRTQAVLNGGVYYRLTELDHDRIRDLLAKNYLVILTRRSCHLTTYLISIASLIKTGRFSHYTHALMNVEGDLAGHVGYK